MSAIDPVKKVRGDRVARDFAEGMTYLDEQRKIIESQRIELIKETKRRILDGGFQLNTFVEGRLRHWISYEHFRKLAMRQEDE